MAKIRFVCSKCGKEAWFDVNIDTYVVTAIDLICDNCTEMIDMINYMADFYSFYWDEYIREAT